MFFPPLGKFLGDAFSELEDTDPDRWVEIPMDGLTLRGNATDGDVQTSMTAADLAALPDADMSAVNNTTM